MSYPPRLFKKGFWYHVYTKGQRSEPLFFSPDDRKKYLFVLDRELSRRDGKIGSYCLMTNHLHVLIQMQETDLSEIFQTVHMKYAKYFNQKRDTEGHVFQDRPGMKIILDDSYLRELVGYIHQNPVDAGIVQSVNDYRWSSWRWFLEGVIEDFAEANIKFPPNFKEGRKAKRFKETLKVSLDLPGDKNYWGTDDEWNSLERREDGREGGKFKERRGKKPKKEIIDRVLDGSSVSQTELKSQSQARRITQKRHQAIGEMYDEGYSASEIARYFNRTPQSVRYSYKQWKNDNL